MALPRSRGSATKVISECHRGARVALKDYSDMRRYDPGDRTWYPHRKKTSMMYLCCIAHKLFFCKQSNRQLEPPLPLNFSCRTFRNSALAPIFSFEPYFGKAGMGSLVHSRECGKATAVFVPSFEADLVAESRKYGSRRLNLPFLVL